MRCSDKGRICLGMLTVIQFRTPMIIGYKIITSLLLMYVKCDLLLYEKNKITSVLAMTASFHILSNSLFIQHYMV